MLFRFLTFAHERVLYEHFTFALSLSVFSTRVSFEILKYVHCTAGRRGNLVHVINSLAVCGILKFVLETKSKKMKAGNVWSTQRSDER